MSAERDNELWQRALVEAELEATHSSEIETRALVYYWKLKQPVPQPER